MMNMMVKDVYRNFSAASEKVLVPKICVLDRGQLTDGGGGGGRGGGGQPVPSSTKYVYWIEGSLRMVVVVVGEGGVQKVPSSIKSVTYFLQCVVIFV